MKLLILIFFSLFFINAQIKAQEYNYYHYDIKDGLSGITVYSIAQDKDGFLWFGTETGLSRFDGNNFKNYTGNDGLNENEIISLFVDSKNRVWIFPFKNSIYYYYHGKIYNASNDTLLKKFHLKNEIFKASEDKNGNVFFLEADRIHILSKTNKLIEVNKIEGESFDSDGCGNNANDNCILFLSFTKDIYNPRISSYEYKNSKFLFKEAIQDYNLTRNAVEINANYAIVRNVDIFKIFNYKTNEQYEIRVPDHFHTISYVNDSCLSISTSEKTFLFNIYQKKMLIVF